MLLNVAVFLAALGAQGDRSSDLQCILDRVPATVQASIGAAMDDGGAAAPMERVGEAAAECARRFGWSDEALEAFTGLASSAIIGEQAQMRLHRAGIDTLLIDQWFDAQSAAVRTDLEPGQPIIAALLQHLMDNGVAETALDGAGQSIGVYLGALIVITRVEAGMTPT